MQITNKSKRLNYYFFYPLVFVITIWLVFAVENAFHYNFAKYGVRPNSLKGLRGVFFSPLIHDNFSHIFNNSIPLFILTSFLFFHYKRVAWKILFYGWLLTGLGTWLIGRESYHIGISGINYMLISFLFFSGIMIKYYRLIAVSLIVVFLYGSLIWYMFPIVEYISWEAHLSGFLSGIFLAVIYAKRFKTIYKNMDSVKITPEDEEFLRHFDKNGNFIEISEKNDNIDASLDI